MSMSVRARVKNGRLTLDEPTDLPEGTEVDLVSADDAAWELDPEHAAELTSRLADDRAECIPADVVFARLRGAR